MFLLGCAAPLVLPIDPPEAENATALPASRFRCDDGTWRVLSSVAGAPSCAPDVLLAFDRDASLGSLAALGALPDDSRVYVLVRDATPDAPPAVKRSGDRLVLTRLDTGTWLVADRVTRLEDLGSQSGAVHIAAGESAPWAEIVRAIDAVGGAPSVRPAASTSGSTAPSSGSFTIRPTDTLAVLEITRSVTPARTTPPPRRPSKR